MPKNAELNMSGPGVAPVRIPELDKLIEEYVKARDRRCRETPREVAAKTSLIDGMHKHIEEIGRDAEGVARYEYGDHIAEVRPGKETLRVRAAEPEE